MSDAKTRKWNPLDVVLAFVFVGLYIWLRWWSGWWQNRWAGFALGAALTVFLVISGGRTGYEPRTKGFFPPKSFFLSLGIILVAVGIISLVRFLRGASGDEGFSGLVTLSLGIQQAYMYRWVSKQDAKDAST